MITKRLSRNVKFNLIYQDETRFGSAITDRCDLTVRECCTDIIKHRQEYGLQDTIARSQELIAAAFIFGHLSELCTDSDELLEDWLYPNPALVKPVALQIERDLGEEIAQSTIPVALMENLADYLGDWESGSAPPQNPQARALWDEFVILGVLEDVEPKEIAHSTGITFVGHSTVMLSDGDSTLLFDPFLLPQSNIYPEDYQPLSLREMGRPSAVFITHSHPDHFDLGTLLRVGADTPIFVPEVPRETVLAINMAARLRQLGFRQVQTLQPFTETTIGKMRVIALPFYGEQPTVREILHSEVRNQGNTYLIELNGRFIALTADSGMDQLGDVKELAVKALQLYGAIDFLFGGYRGFGLYPIQYLFSSVSRYLPFVPHHSWQVRQQIMCDADDLIDVAEIWNAKQIVPYSDGGAPWYWLRGLGPTLDGTETPIMAVDPTPESVAEVAKQRTGTRHDGLLASPVPICLLRPNDALLFKSDRI